MVGRRVHEGPGTRGGYAGHLGRGSHCGLTAAIAALGANLGVPASFVDAFVFGAIAAGIAFMSRTAAVLGLALYAAESLYKFSTIGFKGVPLTIVLMIGFLNSVRGAFAFHAFDGTAPAAPTRAPARVQPASRSLMATVAIAIAIVVVGIDGYFAMQLELEREAKGTRATRQAAAAESPRRTAGRAGDRDAATQTGAAHRDRAARSGDRSEEERGRASPLRRRTADLSRAGVEDVPRRRLQSAHSVDAPRRHREAPDRLPAAHVRAG